MTGNEVIRRLFFRGKIVCYQYKGNPLFTNSGVKGTYTFFFPFEVDAYKAAFKLVAVWRIKLKP